ncbi:hypothetical protein FJT64_015914 [Amphibalanus amphitrite]|uniref:Uncharacterized protein n=1 Tax=Amphibalanus amphitrite TaxID=1232801 RepID=A0A6A4XG30_AMPAM|nr:hypothetical protein FJT64_015914 [Amphibalanus amphitrite]
MMDSRVTLADVVEFLETEAVESSMLDNVQVSGLGGESWHQLPMVFTLQSLPVTVEDRCPIEEVRKWAHLSDVQTQQVTAPVELLIGVNAPHLHVATDVATWMWREEKVENRVTW